MKIRIGVIGAGIMGQQYVRIYQDHPYAEVTAVAAKHLNRAREAAARFNVPLATGDWHTITESADIDAVCIALPDDEHFAATQSALLNGKHVLLEKPMTTSLPEADAIVALAEATNLKVQVAFNHRWLAPYHQGKVSIANGDIGAPVTSYARKVDTIFVPTKYINWAHQTTPAWFLSCHDIDLVTWFFNAEPIEAHAWGVRRVLVAQGIDTYDVIQAQVRYDSGAIATFESGWIYPNTFPTMVDSFISVIGEHGHLHFDRKRESLEMSTPTAFTYPKTFLSADVFGTLRGAFPSCLDDFVNAIRKDLPPAVNVHDGRKVTAVLTAIHESLATGANVPVQPYTKESL
ncbi:Gfo/Idh/MocA family protein [Granulicella sibirica]|uniref:GFO/IDH/MOCA family oxidoreductase n=1 Tax=Granulicella sibirica TaxID=2479048 RepID=A0A4Q0SX27_9BACT|nr:Gfo/Idh/MocA family oxidoreductase [Granulicella sibirica]RXH54138.1 GFO/IDH/MOCA family oxidoreductase [Granulicella sibirica]